MKLLCTFWVGCTIILSGASQATQAVEPTFDNQGLLTTCQGVVAAHTETEWQLNQAIELKLDYIASYGKDDTLVYALDAVVESWALRIHAIQLTYNYFECDLMYELYDSKGKYYESESE
ncbi:conserved hypothetical protein [Vibrio phage 409E50-1]|nr:conserved hypothetical protein [Vibrio phage 521E56-1]CAH9013062.1 conserved hypothetical protein [Vibrio phage 384E50-1]CAH9013100.1 conserved hypothetical protein [Vibrio phage 409E50-1]CAH9013130.1 conserved hypothetical protein [Vibrio phage 402E50-1]CAH9013835.1 conserved hypothetical protein [Vibrio phage 405E50-1]CAH9013888.1 conserved hypothetical protein [Vibrio phage 413E50-1]